MLLVLFLLGRKISCKYEVVYRDFEKNCPILIDILHDLFPYDESCDNKGKGAIHALSLLASLKNKQCRNDITLMLISFGAGCRMVNMLSWSHTSLGHFYELSG